MALTNTFLQKVMTNLFQNSGVVDLGTSASEKVSGNGYAARSGQLFGWESSNNGLTRTNANNVYYPIVTGSGSYTANYLLITQSYSVNGTAYNGIVYAGQLQTPVTVTAGQQVKISSYVQNANRGVSITISGGAA